MLRRKVLGIGASSATMLVEDTHQPDSLKVLKRINVSGWEPDEAQRLADLFLMLSKASGSRFGPAGPAAVKHLVRVESINLQNAFVNIVLEYCPLGTLADALEARTEPLSDTEIVEWSLCIASALQELHGLGFCHHHIQLSSCFLTEGGGSPLKLGIPMTERMYWQRFDDAKGRSLEEYPPEVRSTRRLYCSFSSDLWHLGLTVSKMMDFRSNVATRSSYARTEVLKIVNAMMQEDVPSRPALSVVLSALQRLLARQQQPIAPSNTATASASLNRVPQQAHSGEWHQHAEAQLRELEACQQQQKASHSTRPSAMMTATVGGTNTDAPLHHSGRATMSFAPSPTHVDAFATRKSLDLGRTQQQPPPAQQELRVLPKHKRMEALEQMTQQKMQRRQEYAVQRAERQQQRAVDQQAAQELQRQHREQMRSIRQSHSKLVQKARRESREEGQEDVGEIQIFVKEARSSKRSSEPSPPSPPPPQPTAPVVVSSATAAPRNLGPAAVKAGAVNSPTGSTFWNPVQEAEQTTTDAAPWPSSKIDTVTHQMPIKSFQQQQQQHGKLMESSSPEAHPRPPLEDASPPPASIPQQRGYYLAPTTTRNAGFDRVAEVSARSAAAKTDVPPPAGLVRSMAVLEWYIDTLRSSIKTLMDPPVFDETMGVVHTFAASTTRDRADPTRNADFLTEIETIVGDRSVMHSAIPLFCQLVALESSLRMSQDLEASSRLR